MAERTLDGEIPHLDFDESYSGALTWLNAGAFRLWGPKLVSMRIPLMLCYLVFLATLYLLARRWLSPLYAGLFGLATLSWAIPAYFAALPSWYLIFFSGYGTFFLMKHIETGKMKWLFLAGVCGGVAICFKILGIYFVFAGVVFILYQEKGNFSWLSLTLKSSLVAVIFLTLTLALWKHLGIKEFIHFLFPAACVIVVSLKWDAVSSQKVSAAGTRRLCTLGFYFLSGVAAPMVLFVLYFLKHKALGLLTLDLFVLPLRRYEFAFYALPPLWTTMAVLPLFFLFWRARLDQEPPPPWKEKWTLAALLSFILLGADLRIYQGIWLGTRPMVPLIIACGCWGLAHNNLSSRLSWLNRQRLFLILTVTAFVSLIQFPDSFGIYFFYVSSFVALAGMALFRSFARRLHLVGAGVLLSYGLFGFLWVSRAEPGLAGVAYGPRRSEILLLPERAGLWVGRKEFETYENLSAKIKERSADSEYIYAGPDCPQVYFLSSKKNPTRFFYDFFAPEKATSEAIIKKIQEKNIKVVVLNASPGFSRPITKEFYDAIAQRFKHHEDFNQFRMFW